MYQVGTATLRSCFGMEVRIDVVQERFLTFRAQDKYIVLVNLTVQVFLAIGRDFPNEPYKFRFAILLLRFRNYSIEE
jgi:hypothetical protein